MQALVVLMFLYLSETKVGVRRLAVGDLFSGSTWQGPHEVACASVQTVKPPC